MTRPLLLLLSISILAISACANSDYFEADTLTTTDNALVYVYRPAATNPGKKPLRTSYPEVMIDGKSQGFLGYNEYIAVELPPGTLEFLATGLTKDARWEPEDVKYDLKVEAGQTYFLRLRVEFNTARMTIGSFKGQYLIHMHPVAESEAIYEIRHTNRSTKS